MLEFNTNTKSPNSSHQTNSELFLEGGFKLSSLEILNWGTFDGKIWKIETDGKGALITGENGSGKSTLVDAILTLLVANNKRNYNLSSGSGKRERSESTYVRGAYGNKMEELGVAKTKFCREEGKTYSILLAQFENLVLYDKITLAQFFWYDRGELKKFYITSTKDLSISHHFTDFQTPQDLKKRLKTISGTQVFDSFSDYQMTFMSHVGPKSLKAMDLFNQVVAIKEVAHLSEFVRKHMLEGQNVQDLIEQLYANYDNLNLSHQAILQARSQLEILVPMGESVKNLETIKQEQLEAEQEEKKIPLYFSLQRKKYLTKLVQTSETELEQKESEKSHVIDELNSLIERKNQIFHSIKQDNSGQELEKTQLLIKQMQDQKNQRQKTFAKYEALTKKLNLIAKADLKTFTQNRENLKSIEQDLEVTTHQLQEQTYHLRKELELYHRQTKQFTEDLALLKKTKGNIPSIFLKVREELCAQLSVTRSELPFIAELIQVSSKERKLWNNAIEKLLRSFGLRLLVPAHLYTKINKYLSKTNIGIKLIYNKVDLEEKTYALDKRLSLFEQQNYQQECLIDKLEFQTRSPYVKWLKAQLDRDFDFICTDEVSVFQSSSKAIMTSGLIKRGPSLHEKDDRFEQQGFQSLLGWDNSVKLNEIQENYRHAKQQYDSTQAQLHLLEKQTHAQQDLKLAARDLGQIQDFSLLDWEFCLEELERLQKHKEKLSKGNLSQLQKDFDLLIEQEMTLQKKRDQLLSEMAVLRSNLSQWPAEIQMTNQIIDQILSIAAFDLKQDQLFLAIEKMLKKKKIDLTKMRAESITLLQRELSEENMQNKKGLDQKIETLHLLLLKKMTQFKVKFSEASTDLQASMEYLPDFLTLLDRLQKEALPEHEKRFKTLLNKSVVNDMAAFKSTLELAYDEITESMEQLNESLKKIPYSEGSHVQIYLSRSKDVEIREFNNMLRNALKLKATETAERAELRNIDLEESFAQIKKILDRLKKDQNWCKTVTDVRNWADFYVLELNNSDGTQKNYYADSAGLSGGQKAKLAFTILASAIAYQYGLHKDNAHDKSFRFVVIDEAFSKSDEKNSQYALELFLSLGLQLFVVTPKDKIHVVEPYVKNIFLTHINDQLNHSKITTLSIDEFRQVH